MPGIAGAMMQPARRRQVETCGRATRLQKHRRETVEARGLIGDPQRIGKLVRPRDQKAERIDAVQETHARRIRVAGFAKTFGRPDPENRRRVLLQEKAGHGQHEGRRRAGVARDRRMDLGQADTGQAASQSRVETLGPGDEKLPARHVAMPDEVDIPVDTLGAAVEPFGEAAFDLRNLMAQRRNGPLRHGSGCHDVQRLPKVVPVMF